MKLLTTLTLLIPVVAFAQSPDTEAEVQQAIIQQSMTSYQASSRPCACPFNTMRNGSSCGGRSAYSRPGGAMPTCYVRDITPQMIQRWRASAQ